MDSSDSQGYAPGSMQAEILRAIHLHGGVTAIMAEQHGWTRRGLPCPEMRELVTRRIVAPRVLTSQPLRIVWQLRAKAHDRHNDERIAREARRLRLKEYAPGGFMLELRKELRK